MIGYLKGVLIEKNTDNILIDVSGVGYEIEVPASTLCQLPSLHQEIQIHILTHVREDAIRLFGFSSSFDKKVFQELINVTGVGPKVALGLLGPVDGLILCEIITSGQIAKLTAIPGVGAKTAERLLLELKSKMQKLLARKKDDLEISKFNTNLSHESSTLEKQKLSKKLENKLIRKQIVDDLKSALIHLGYKDKQFVDTINALELRMEQGEIIPLEIALKESLSKLSERIIQKH